MLSLHPIAAFNDNYIWAIIHPDLQQVIIVDPGDAKPVLDFLQHQQLTLTQLWLTHHHADHIGGVDELSARFPDVAVVAPADIQPLLNVAHRQTVGEGSELDAWGHPVQVWQTPGHTAQHVAYLLTWQDRLHVFCGDTLFRAGCGRVFTGTIAQLFDSFERFNELHDADTLFYPAHEYTLSNLAFAQHLQPDNSDIAAAIAEDRQKREQARPTLPTTLADERRINPFLAIIDHPDALDLIAQVNRQLPGTGDDTFAVFAALRELKNRF